MSEPATDKKIGDVVKLKSGGPEMTIISQTNEQDIFKCSWFDGNGEHREGEFSLESLCPKSS